LRNGRWALDAPEIVISVLKEARKTHPELDEVKVCIALKRLNAVRETREQEEVAA